MSMVQTKELDKTPEEQLSEVEIGSLPEKEIRVMIVNMIQDLRKRMEVQTKKIQDMFNKELEDLTNRDEQYNNRNEKYTTGNQQQNKRGRKTNK